MTIPKQTGEGTFLTNCIQLYEAMLAELKCSKNNKTAEEERIQNCFEIAGAYKDKLNQLVRHHKFLSKEEEVFFFKKIKPLFTAEVEFFTYLYHIELFKTKEIESDNYELEQFYKRQLQKRDKLRKEQPDFYHYVQEGHTSADIQWFTRKCETMDSSLFDGLMGRYLAIEKFELYLKDKMNARD
jgi:hypothetical protein